MGTFSPQAYAASLKARRRNALLRRQGKLPPTKGQLKAMARKNATSIPLDAIPALPEKRKYTKPVKTKASDVGLRVLALLERLL